jgi:hypothetical protein
VTAQGHPIRSEAVRLSVLLGVAFVGITIVLPSLLALAAAAAA